MRQKLVPLLTRDHLAFFTSWLLLFPFFSPPIHLFTAPPSFSSWLVKLPLLFNFFLFIHEVEFNIYLYLPTLHTRTSLVFCLVSLVKETLAGNKFYFCLFLSVFIFNYFFSIVRILSAKLNCSVDMISN